MLAAKEKKLGIIVAGLILGMLMSAMDNTVVVIAMGTIVGDLGGCLMERENGV